MLGSLLDWALLLWGVSATVVALCAARIDRLAADDPAETVEPLHGRQVIRELAEFGGETCVPKGLDRLAAVEIFERVQAEFQYELELLRERQRLDVEVVDETHGRSLLVGGRVQGLGPEPLPRGELRGVEVKRTNFPKGNFLLYLGGAAPLLFLLSACNTTGVVEPRQLTSGGLQPLCLAFCQITEAVTSHEGNYGEGITSTYSGGTASASQTRGQ